MSSSRIYVRICGKGFNIVSDEDDKYMREVAGEVDSRMGELIRSDTRVTYDTAAVLTALNLCSELKSVKLLTENKEEDALAIEALQKKLEAAESSVAELKKELLQQKELYVKEKEKMRLEWVLREKEFLDMIDEG